MVQRHGTDRDSYAQLRLQMHRWHLQDETRHVAQTLMSDSTTGDMNLEHKGSAQCFAMRNGSVPSISTLAADDSLQGSDDSQSQPSPVTSISQHDIDPVQPAAQKLQQELKSTIHQGSEGEQQVKQVTQPGGEDIRASLIDEGSLGVRPVVHLGDAHVGTNAIIPSLSMAQNMQSKSLETQSSRSSHTPLITPKGTASKHPPFLPNTIPTEDFLVHFIDDSLRSLSRSGGILHNPQSERSAIAKYMISMVSHSEMPISSLLSQWPGFENPPTLLASQVDEIQGVAAILAAVGLFDDAFDLFFVEYKYWEAHKPDTSDGSVDENVRRMVTAAINCIRNSRHGKRRNIADLVLLYVRDHLVTHGPACDLDLALINLYLLNDSPTSWYVDRKQDTMLLALCSSMYGNPESFKVIRPEIQDREKIFMTRSLGKLVKQFRPDALMFRHSLQRLFPQCIPDCEWLRAAFQDVLESCRTFVEKHRHSFNKIGDCFRTDAQSHTVAVWTFYYFYVRSISSFDYLVQTTSGFRSVRISGQDQTLGCDTLLILAVISESFLTSGTEKTRFRSLGPRFGDYIQGEIKALVLKWPKRGYDLAASYLTRIYHIPDGHELSMVSSETSPDVLRAYVGRTLRRSGYLDIIYPSPLVKSLLFEQLSHDILEGDASQKSTAGSSRSSLNSIRSSMSWGTKEMIETKNRLRQRFSTMSNWSRTTGSSNAMSIDSHGSNSFERVTGMRWSLPDEDTNGTLEGRNDQNEALWIDRIDEEMEDVDDV